MKTKPKKLKKSKTSKKPDKQELRQIELNKMSEFLSHKWNNDVQYSCGYCLEDAYNAVISDRNGYITDEELMKSSKFTLRYK